MKKKGFTLIELLAVIVVLAIIALIATPMVLNTIEDAKKGAAKSSTLMMVDAARLYHTRQYINPLNQFEGFECSISDGKGCDELSLKGQKPDKGIITISNKGVVNGKVEFGKYTYYICNDQVSEEETAGCSVTDYSLIYDITNEGVITGFKRVEETAFFNIIEEVKASELTDEAKEVIENKSLTIPEYVGDIEVNGIAANAFTSYEIEKVTILPNKKIAIGENAFPENLVKLRVSECYAKQYSQYKDILETFSSNCEGTVSAICKRATKLHEETCTNASSNQACRGDGYLNTVMKFGNETTEVEKLNSGDAFDCDVNGDKTYDPDTERFYYVTDLSANPEYAVLIYYNNTVNGEPNNKSGIAYYNVNNSYSTGLGPVSAMPYLPRTDQWTNVSLANPIRDIINEKGAVAVKGYSYEGYAARFLSYDEISTACGVTMGAQQIGELSKCRYLLENTNYSTTSIGLSGYWIENPTPTRGDAVWTMHAGLRRVDNSNNQVYSGTYGVRPVIEVLKTDIDY